jgi:hypothetical protein
LAINVRVPLILSSLLAVGGHVGFGRTPLFSVPFRPSFFLNGWLFFQFICVRDDTVESRPMDVAVLELISHALWAPLSRFALNHARYRASPEPNAV